MIAWTDRAKKDLERLPDRLQEKAESVISDLGIAPSAGKKLKGSLAGMRSVRLGRAHRILYEVSEGTVFILTIGPRKDVYR